jgi:hypothetical protein
VQAVRHLLAKRHLATLICAAALLLKLLVPAGYMIARDHGRITITICSGIAPRTMTLATPRAMTMPGMHGAMPDHGTPKDHGNKAEQPCAFAGLSALSLGATDPVLLAALIAFVMAIGLAGVLPPMPAQPARLRPPLRAPPAYL